MKPYIHAVISAKRYGGKPEDYLEIHNFIDSSKIGMADVRHRAILHSSFGVFLTERFFGVTITNSIGKVISVRDIAEEHVAQDLGFVPSIDKWLGNLPIEQWMTGEVKKGSKKRIVTFNNVD